MSRPDVLPDAAREHAWRLLWERLLQSGPDNSPAPDPGQHPDDETTAAGEETAT
jgi:hypothetical protein